MKIGKQHDVYSPICISILPSVTFCKWRKYAGVFLCRFPAGWLLRLHARFFLRSSLRGWFAFARGLVSLAGSPRVFLRCTRAFFLILYNSIFWGGRETSTLEAGFSPSPDPSLSSSTGACRCFLHETYFSLRSLRFGFCVLHTGLFFLILCNSFSGVGENSDWQQTCGLGFSQAYRFAVNCLL